jgi:ankyrin repeat protein
MTHTSSLLQIALGSALLLTACRLEPSTPLTSAAFRGDAAQVKALLATTSADTAADVWTPLIWAARAGRVEVMTLLLDAGADPNRRDSRHGWTPLMHAQHVKQDGAAALLLARGADGTRGAGGTSPLEMAALDNDVEMLRALLAAKPPRDQQVRAFDLAVSGGVLADLDRPLLGGCHPEAVTVLLAYDKTLARIPDGLGSPVWWARQRRCEATIGQVAAANTANSAQKAP